MFKWLSKSSIEIVIWRKISSKDHRFSKYIILTCLYQLNLYFIFLCFQLVLVSNIVMRTLSPSHSQPLWSQIGVLARLKIKKSVFNFNSISWNLTQVFTRSPPSNDLSPNCCDNTLSQYVSRELAWLLCHNICHNKIGMTTLSLYRTAHSNELGCTRTFHQHQMIAQCVPVSVTNFLFL